MILTDLGYLLEAGFMCLSFALGFIAALLM
jgi:hypothetical protein